MADDPDDLKIERAFGIFVFPSYEPGEDGIWLAHVVGHELDNITQAHNPVDAVAMAHDMLKLITGTCGFPARKGGHEFSIESELVALDDERPYAALECSRCGEKRIK